MKMKQTFKKRLVSGLLALVMVLGFLPANLFPLAEAADALPPDGAAGTTVGKISLSISTDGSYTVTLKSTTANPNARVTFAVIPAFTSKSTAIQDAMGTRLPYSNMAAGNLLNNIGPYYDNGASGSATLPADISHNQVSAVLVNGGTNTWTGSLGSSAMSTLNSFAASHPNPNGIKPADGVFTYILLFVTGASQVQWTYATISAEGEPTLTSSNDIVIHHTAGEIVGGYDPTTTITNNGSGPAYISNVEYTGLDSTVTTRLTGIAKAGTLAKNANSTYGVQAGTALYAATPTQSGYVTITYTTATDTGKPSGTAPTKTLTVNVTIIDDRFNITVPQELIFTGGYDGTTITWTSKPDLVLTPNHDQGPMWFSEDGAWMRWDGIVIGNPTVCSVSDGNQYGWDISSLTGQLTNRTSASNYALGAPSSLSPGSITSVTDYVAYLTIPYSYQCWYNENTDDYGDDTSSPPENDASWTWDEVDTYTGSVMVKLIARLTPQAAPTTYKVDFAMNDSTTNIYKTINSVISGSTISAPPDPTRSGFAFGGWYKEAECTNAWDFNTDTVTDDTRLYAKWTAQCTIDFDINLPDWVENNKTNYGLTVPTAPASITGAMPNTNVTDNGTYTIALAGYEFKGWAKDNPTGSVVWKPGFSYEIKSSGTLYAIWEPYVPTMSDILYGGASLNTTSKLYAEELTGNSHKLTDFVYTFDTDRNGTFANTSLPIASSNIRVDVDSNNCIRVSATGTPVTGTEDPVYIKWLSKLNGKTGKVKLELKVPPLVDHADATSSIPDGTFTVGCTVTIEKIYVTGDNTGDVPNKLSTDNNQPKYEIVKWAYANEGSNGTTPPNRPADIPSSAGETTITLTGAQDGDVVWAVIKGYGQLNDGADTTPVWVRLGRVGAVEKELKVQAVVLDKNGTPISGMTTFTGLTLGGGTKLAAKGTATVTANYSGEDYEFIGWSVNPDGSSPAKDGNSIIIAGNGKLDRIAVNNRGGSATFAMSDPAAPATVYAVYKQVPTNDLTIISGTGIQSVSVTVNGVVKTVTGNKVTGIRPTDTVVITSVAQKYYQCNDFTFNPATTTNGVLTIKNHSASVASINVLGSNVSVTANAKPLANLEIKGTQNYADAVVGYGSVGPIFTATMTNPGAKDATLSYALYGNAAGTTAATGFSLSPTTGTMTVLANATGSSNVIYVTPNPGLGVGTYDVWLKVTESTAASDTYSGKQLEYTQKITFVVKADDKYTGKVTVRVNGTATSTGVTKVEAKNGSDTVNMTGSSGVYSTAANALNTGKGAYSVYINDVDTGYVIHAGGKDQIVDLYTINVAKDPPAGSAVNPTPTLQSGTQIGTLGYVKGSVVTVTAGTAASGYVFDKWTVVTGSGSAVDSGTSTSVAITMAEGKKTVTANYVVTVTRTYDYGYNRAGGRTFYTQSGLKSGTAVPKISPEPSRPGYTFAGWYSAASGGTAIDFTANLTADQTVYAHWTQVTPSWSTLPSGEYGKDYNGMAAITSGNVGTVTYSVTSGSLPAGLKMDNNGNIVSVDSNPAKPREAGTFNFTVTATSAADNTTTWSQPYTLTVNKATPVITGIQFTVASGEIGTGTNVADLRITAKVTAPYYNGTTWDVNKPFTYTTYDPASGTTATAPGGLAISAISGSTTLPTTLTFGSGVTSLPADVKLTPGTVSGVNYANIYNEATGSGYINEGNQIYSFTAPAPTFASIGSDKAAGDAAFSATGTVTIRNTSSTNTEGYFSYTLENADGTPYTLGEFTVSGFTGEKVLDTAMGSDRVDLTVSLVGSKLAGKIGDHIMFIHIVEKDKAGASGTVKAETRVPVTLTITAAPFTGTVTTKLNKTDNTSATGDSGRTVTLRKLGDTTPITGTGSSGVYTFSTGLTAGETYSVWIDGVQVPNLFITNDKRDVEVNLYQVALTTSDGTSALSPAPSMDGAGYYLENESVGLKTPATHSISSVTYNFVNWTTTDSGVTSPLPGATTAFKMPGNAVTMTANYKKPDAPIPDYSVTYDPGVSTGTIPTVPVDTHRYQTGDEVKISNMTPVRPGYTFGGWSGAPGVTGNAAAGSTFTMENADVTLTAQWTAVTLAWTDNLPAGTYGSDYYGSVSMDTSSTGPVTYTATGLPGGLTMATDGTITGKPYEVNTTGKSITVTATSTTAKDGSGDFLTWTHSGTITVNKARPTLVVTSASGAHGGQDHNTATYVVEVSVPKLTGTPSTWGTEKYTYTWNTDQGSSTGNGTLSVTSTGTFPTTGATSTVGLHWEPGTGTNADAHNNAYNAIYEAGDVTVDLGANDFYGITADPIANTWRVKVGYGVDVSGTTGAVTSNTAQALQVVVTNTGNRPTGDLALSLKTGTYFTIGTTSPVSTIDTQNGRANVTVYPKAGVTASGVYTDTLTIENTATGVKATVGLTLVVERADTFDFEIHTHLNPVTGTASSHDVKNIVLRATDGSGNKAYETSRTAGSGVYNWSGLDSSKAYAVVVNGYPTANVVTADTKDAHGDAKMVIDLYQVTVAAGTGGTAALVDADNNGYYVEGQNYDANATANTGYRFDKWAKQERGETSNTNYSTSPNIKDAMGKKAVTLTANFAEVVKYEIKLDTTGSTFAYSSGKGIGDILSGGTVVNDSGTNKYMVDSGATFGITMPGDDSYSITRAGYTFRGWTTASGGTTATTVFTADNAADTGDGAADRIITLYPVWTKDADLAFTGETVKGVYKHSLTHIFTQATGGTGIPAYDWADKTTLGTTYKPFEIELAPNGSTAAFTGTPNDVGTKTADVTVTKNGATKNATFTFEISKADMKLKDSTTLPTVSIAAGTDDTTAKAAITTRLATTKPDGDGTGETDITGAWSVTGTIPTTPGTHWVEVTYTAANGTGTGDRLKDGDHYNNLVTKVQITVAAKVITGVTVTIEFPKDADQTAQGKDDARITAVTSNPTGAVVGDVDIKSVTWSGSGYNSGTGKFSPTKDIMLTVVLTPHDPNTWHFTGDTGTFTGNFNGQAGTTALTDVDVSCSATEAVLTYTWPAAPSDVEEILVRVDAPSFGGSIEGNNTAICLGTPVGSFKPELVKWVQGELSTVNSGNYAGLTAASGSFAAGKYTVIVTATANASYKFTDIYANLDASNDKAKINGFNAKVLAKDISNGTVTIAYDFEVKENPIVATSSATGGLVFYAKTAATGKHSTTTATGHKTPVDFTLDSTNYTVKIVNSAGAETTTSDFILFVDMNNDKALDAGDIQLATRQSTGTPGTYTFSDEDPTHATAHGSDLDGKKLYAIYAPGGTAAANVTAALVGTLTVRQLEAMSITSPSLGTIVVNSGATYTVTTAGTTTVAFNTDTAGLSNTGVTVTKGSKPATVTTPAGVGDLRPSFYYMVDVNGDGSITDVDDVSLEGTTLTATHNGKDIYACYTDVNGNLVYTKVGTLKIQSTGMTVGITDENGNDPEYGDKLTAVPNGGTGPYTYQWEIEGPAGTWTPISGETGTTHTPGKSEVGKTIRVTVTDSTGATASSDGKLIQPRSLNFVVAKWDKNWTGNDDNVHKYDSGDFTLTVVTDTVPYGGVILGDKVTLSPAGTWNDADGTRPPYAGANVGDNIEWPAITVNTGTGVNQTGGYALDGDDKDYYRLAAQAAQSERGKIKDALVTEVTHVDVHFAEMPTFDHTIPNKPTGVTLETETQPGEGGSTFTATWRDGTATSGAVTVDTKFGAKVYTVAVQVKPKAGYVYDDTNTHFYFHFGAGNTIEVKLTPAAGDKGGVVETGGVYTMYYTFPAVERVKIQHVNVSVPQPVVEMTPNTVVNENQVLGTDDSDQTANLTPGGITWYEGATGATTVAAPDQFAGDKVYRAEFDLTVTNNFEYANNVDFTVNGVGPIVGAATNSSTGNPAIDSVKTEKTGNTEYHVVVTFAQLKGGKVDLTDVVVDASVATEGVTKTGPEVAAAKKTIYDLTGSNNKWQYWNGAAWADASNGTGLSADGKFLAGYDYRVTAQVHLVDTTHYQIGTGTKFYLAGLECGTTAVTGLHGGYTPRTEAGGVYTLIQEFQIPANEIGMVTVTYDLPLNSGTTVPSAPEYYGNQDMVNIANNATSWVKLGTTDTYKNDFTSAGSAPGTTFEESQYYRVTSVVTPKTGYKFTNGTVVVINGVPVTVDGAEGEVKENGTTVAYVKAVTDGNNVKAMLVAKVRSTAIDPIELKHADITPVAENAPSSALFELAKAGEARYEVDTTMHNGGKGTWQYEDSPNHWKNAVINDGLDASGKFLSGTKYRVTVGVKATGTNVFATGASGTVDNTANSTKKNATVQVAADRKTATLTVTFDPTNIKTASMVDVYFRRQPEVGKNPATLQEDGNWVYKFPATVNNAPTETVGTLTGTGMEQFDVKWYDTTGTTFDPSASNTPMTGNFAAHKSYTVTVRVKPAAGWQYILDTDPNTEDTKFTIFASDAGHTSNNVWYDAAKGDYVMWYTFAPTEDPNVIVRVAANVTQPAADETMSSTATKILAQTSMGTDVTASGLNLGTVSWKESADGTTWSNATGSFAAGKYYQATFTASAASGYSFLADGADNVDFLVNSVGWIDGAGSKTENGIKVETAQNGGTNSYTITVTFPMTGSTADILTVWGNAKEPVAGGTINHGDITVSPAEPYAIKSNTNKWYTNAACTTEATGTFQPGTTYYARLTVELKGQYSGIYQFAQTTQGYINDTTGGTTVMRDPTTGTPTSITLTRAFPVPAVSTDLMVYGNAVEPTAGNTASANNITAINGQPYEKASAQWLDDTGNPFTGQFQPGKTYIAELTVRVKNTNTHSFDASTKGFLNNGEVTGADKILNADGTLTLRKSFKLEDSSITKVVVNSATPTPGSALPDSINPGDSSKYTFENANWGPADATVEYSKTYTMTVTVVPKDDTINLPGTDTSGYTWNGRTASSAVDAGDGKYTVTFEYTTGPKPADPPPPSGGGTTTVELPVVTYWISDHGFTNDLTAEKMSRSGAKPTFTPKVSGKEGYTFKGWSEVDPATLKQGEEVKLVDPLTFSISADKTFYAVYDEPRFEHDHYVSGYPDGTFKPEQYITRAEVAAIVANACLDGFDNNENYGNPGNYSDINPKKWYGNDIAYCTMYGVFSGYKDGTFKPDQYITRQELAVVVANMAGMQTNIGMPFTDASSINKWARDGVYTVYKNNWVSGYPDGTFRPQNNITRAETVAIFNGYLHRGVDKDGLAELTPYVLNAAAGGYEGDGSSLYMTWTDVPEKYWAYYHIIEAANDHDYHWADEETKLPPEHWDAAYIDQEWRYREEFPVTYVVGDHGTAADGSVLNLSVKSGGRPRTQPHIDPNTDWTFLGWSLTPTGDIVEPLTVTITGATTFYAVYAPKATTYTVRYDAGANGAVSGASSESVIEGQNPARVPAVNAHEGYTFLGWAETPNGTVVSPADVAITANKTFYAVYRADQPAVQLQSHTAYMSGYDDGTFRPSQAITRADVVTMVVRALGTDYDPSHVYDTSSVTDVAGHPAENMIGYCIEKGIFSGYKDGTFLPEGTMTRQEFAVVIANLAGGAQENQGLPFTDASSVNKWARNAVYTVYVNGWIGGYKDGSFQPKNNITRAEAAVIFNGFLGRSVDKTSLTDVPVGATSPWSDVKATNWAYQNIMEATADHSFYLDDGVEHWAEP